MNAQEYYINIRPGNGFAETIKISQYDVGRPLAFHLMDGAGPLAIPSGSTVTIRGTKPSGLGFTEDCTISGSTASVSTTLGMSQEFGFFPVELVVAYNDDVIATGNAMLLVEMSPHQTGTTDGVAEDLQDIYEQLDDLKDDIENISGISDDVKVALLDCFAHVAWTDEHGQDYYDALEEALYAEEPKTLVSISADYTQSGTVYDTDSLDSLKDDLVVTATYDDSTTETVTAYTLSGTLETGTSTITVSYGGKTTTFMVTVTTAPLYALENAVNDQTDYRITTTKGGHVKIEFKNALSSADTGKAVNIYTRELGDLGGSSSIINNKPKVFTIPNGEQCVYSVSNVVDSTGITANHSLGLRKALATSSVSDLSIATIGTGGSKTATLSASADVACPFLYILLSGQTIPANSVYEFDTGLTVNGTRYV